MEKNYNCKNVYQAPRIQQLEVQTEGYLAASPVDKYGDWNDGLIEDRFNDLGNF